MKKTIDSAEFVNMFTDYGRQDNFSYDGMMALFDFFTELEEETGEEMEVDIIGICCDFTEYENIEEFQGDYGEDYEDINDVERSTIVIPIDNGRFIIQAF